MPKPQRGPRLIYSGKARIQTRTDRANPSSLESRPLTALSRLFLRFSEHSLQPGKSLTAGKEHMSDIVVTIVTNDGFRDEWDLETHVENPKPGETLVLYPDGRRTAYRVMSIRQGLALRPGEYWPVVRLERKASMGRSKRRAR